MYLKSLKCVCENININNYFNFYTQIKNGMQSPQWLGNFSCDDLLYLLNTGSKIWIYYDNDKPVCSMMYIPCCKSLKKKLNINCKLKDIGECGPIFVSSEYRGLGLQNQMLLQFEDYCKINNKKYILTTIHPKNMHSINNFIKQGYKLETCLMLDRGERNVYSKKISLEKNNG